MQKDVYHRPHTINKKIYSVYYSCESRISFLFLNIKYVDIFSYYFRCNRVFRAK